MAKGYNYVSLFGNLGQDPELRHTGSGYVLNFRLATTESYLDQNRVRQERTEWHSITVWGKRGEALARLLSRGSRVMVVGSLRTSSWDAPDGTKRYRTGVVAHEVILAGATRSTGGPQPREDEWRGREDEDLPYAGGDDDIPF